jgi:SnoaL-like domain
LTTATRIAAALLVVVAAIFAWRSLRSDDEREVRQRLESLTVDVNRTASEGLDTVVRAADIGSYFTDDVVVELGEGAAPIVGRPTLVGMASRLQRRTAAFRLRFDDVGVQLAPGAAADVTLTASFVPLDDSPGEESLDAREFTLALTKSSGVWRIARVTAVDTLR